jgi:hypothetical protein
MWGGDAGSQNKINMPKPKTRGGEIRSFALTEGERELVVSGLTMLSTSLADPRTHIFMDEMLASRPRPSSPKQAAQRLREIRMKNNAVDHLLKKFQ